MNKYRCGRHGFFTPDFDREIDGYLCPRILCVECETQSFNADAGTRPRNVPYFYEDTPKVVLQEAHLGSAITFQFSSSARDQLPQRVVIS